MLKVNTAESALRSLLVSGLHQLDIQAENSLVDKFLQFVEQLIQWNQAFNLTAVREADAIITRHLLDSLATANSVTGDRLLDVGAGAGLPGLPLAMLQPDRQFHLLDSNGKKARFMRHAARVLGLNNVTVHEARIEAHQPDHGYDCIVSRAFAAPADFLHLVRHCCHQNTRIIAMRGRQDAATNQPIEGFNQVNIVSLEVPGLNAERHLAIYEVAA